MNWPERMTPGAPCCSWLLLTACWNATNACRHEACLGHAQGVVHVHVHAAAVLGRSTSPPHPKPYDTLSTLPAAGPLHAAVGTVTRTGKPCALPPCFLRTTAAHWRYVHKTFAAGGDRASRALHAMPGAHTSTRRSSGLSTRRFFGGAAGERGHPPRSDNHIPSLGTGTERCSEAPWGGGVRARHLSPCRTADLRAAAHSVNRLLPKHVIHAVCAHGEVQALLQAELPGRTRPPVCVNPPWTPPRDAKSTFGPGDWGRPQSSPY